MTIRKAVAGDQRALVSLYASETNSSSRIELSDITSALNDARATILVFHGQQGIDGAVLVTPQPAYKLEPASLKIDNLFVQAEFRCKGRGRALLDSAEAHAQRLGFEWTSMDRPTSDALLKRYERRGYSAFGVGAGVWLYRPTQDAAT